MFYLLYNLLSLLLLPLVFLFTIYRAVKLKWPLALAARFGYIASSERVKLRGRPVILLHAVSVGEIIAARPLIAALRAGYPDHALVVSNSTETGRQTATAFSEIDVCVYFPFDFLPSVRTMLHLLAPSCIIVMETEIWPIFTREAARRGIPLIMANGRISDRSFPRYQKLWWFFQQPLQNFTLFCMQSSSARERIIAIGAPAERVVVSGNLKYDIPFHTVSSEEKSRLRRNWSIADECLVITSGSTHEGEEAILLTVYRNLLADLDNLLLVLAPRHPQRSAEVSGLLEQRNFCYRSLTDVKARCGDIVRSGEVLLVDTVGDLMSCYALADVAFVGGSLVPVGGHNLLEPASRGVAALFGPDMANFREIAALVLECRAGVQVHSPEELEAVLRRLLRNAPERQSLGNNGLALMRTNGGATGRHLDAFVPYLRR